MHKMFSEVVVHGSRDPVRGRSDKIAKKRKKFPASARESDYVALVGVLSGDSRHALAIKALAP
jgi:hypothetical protein